MAVDNNYNVKVPLDPTSFPSSNQVVIWKPESGSFQLTGSYGSGGGTTGVTATDGTTTVPNATTLNFVNGDVANAGSGQANVSFDLQGVTDNGDNTTRQIIALDGTPGNYANQTSIDATSGFLKVGSAVFTHVTPQLTNKRTTLLSIQSDANDNPLQYPDNYIVYSYVRTTPGTSGTSGGGTTEGGETTDPVVVCSNKFNNSTVGGQLNIATVSAGNTITVPSYVIENSDVILTSGDEVILYTVESPFNYIVATVNFVGSGISNSTFIVDSVNWDGLSTNSGNGFCLYVADVKSLTLEVGGENALGQIMLTTTGSQNQDPRGGMMLTSAGNIYFFRSNASASISGGLQPVSASAKVGFSAYDSALKFELKEDINSNPKTMLYVSKSGDDARIGIGTDKPASIFEVKTQQGSSKESPDFVLSVPSGSVTAGQESSRIAFVIEDETLSGSKLLISGGTAAIYSKVLGSQAGYQYGSLVFEVDGGTLATQDTKAFEIGFGLNPDFGAQQIGTIISSSIVMDGITTPSFLIKQSNSGNRVASIGVDTNFPPTSGGELVLYFNDQPEVKLNVYNEPSYISSSGDEGFGIGTTSPNAKLDVVGSGIFTGSLNVSQSFTASGLYYPDTDGLDRQVLKTDGLGNLSFGYAENVEIALKNVSGGTINKGTPCFITASGTSGNVAGVIPADAGDPTKMPAGVIAGETLADEAEGLGLVNGFIQGVDTSTFASGDTVYVAVGGGYTNVRPTGSGVLIQKLGNVEKSDASNGSGVINGPAYYNELPNWEEGKIQVGTSTYPVTSSVISLDETNKYVSGSESAKFQLGTYAFGYNTFPGFGFDITGSGIIVSSSLPSLHYPMVKIGETELLDLTTATALSDHTFTIHNVDNFQVTSGSEPTNVSTNKLFEHIGDTFKIYSRGNTSPVFTASSSSVSLQGKDVSILPSSGVPYVKVPNVSTIPQYVPVFDAIPNNPSGQELKYITSSTFTGGNSTTLTQIYNQSFIDDIADVIHYLPFKDINEQTTIYQEEAAFFMPFNGRIKQITIRVSNQIDNAGNFTVGVHTCPIGANQFTAANWTEEETEVLAFDGTSQGDDYHAFHFVFDNAQHFEAGDMCTISLQASVDPGTSSYYYVTTIVEFDTTNGLPSSSTVLATNP